MVYTSHGGSFKRSDFGLKRTLPRLTSPAIRVVHLDSPSTKLTDFKYASKQLQFVKRWREAGVGVSGGGTGDYDEREKVMQVAERPGGCAWDRSTFENVEELREIARTGMRRDQRLAKQKGDHERRVKIHTDLSSAPGEDSAVAASLNSSASSELAPDLGLPSFPPDYLNLSEQEFARFVVQLRRLRPKYKAFIKAKLGNTDQFRQEEGDSSEAALLRDMYLLRSDVGSRNQLGLLIDEFLAREKGSQSHDPSLDSLRSLPHHSLGLSYAPPTLYQTDVATRSIPARILGSPSKGGTGTARTPVTAMGVVVRTSGAGGYSPTIYYPDSQGYFSVEFGKWQTRIESASLRKNSISVDDGAPGVEERSKVEQDPTSTILDQEPIILKVYQAPVDNLAGIRNLAGPMRIGSQGWVNGSMRKTGSTTPLSIEAIFHGKADDDIYRGNHLRPPNAAKFDKEGKETQDLIDSESDSGLGHVECH